MSEDKFIQLVDLYVNNQISDEQILLLQAALKESNQYRLLFYGDFHFPPANPHPILKVELGLSPPI